mmetsp:Transcript_18693/g.32791  ORF Transcript_18693/g.32791 Transcript_18693/m.32791 type:complete len:136 (+) Transcript_18693:163-570(+)
MHRPIAHNFFSSSLEIDAEFDFMLLRRLVLHFARIAVHSNYGIEGLKRARLYMQMLCATYAPQTMQLCRHNCTFKYCRHALSTSKEQTEVNLKDEFSSSTSIFDVNRDRNIILQGSMAWLLRRRDAGKQHILKLA